VSNRSWLLPKYLALALLGVGLSLSLSARRASPSGDISPLQTVIRGQSRWLAGGQAALRIIVKNHDTGEPVPGAVHIAITPTDQQAIGRMSLYSGPLKDGTLDAQFTVPHLNPGTYELSVRVVSRLGIDDVKSSVTIARETRILLTADKPLYQPGQTMHLRALALRRPTMAPAAGEPITLEVEDAKGNKVFKKTIEASKFGIVSAEFTLADEINMGRYTIRAVAQDGQAERTVEVKRYVLPKFKVDLSTDRSYYLPGETLTGKVQCDYFFGKPTAESDVLITVSTFDVEFHDVAEIKGKTDENGTFKFEAELPEYFVGQPLEQGNAFVKLEVEVTDQAEHTEKITEMVPVAKDPVIMTVVPESGEIKPGLDNVLYVVLSRPDGTPVKGKIDAYFLSKGLEGPGKWWVTSPGICETDATGIAEVRVTSEPRILEIMTRGSLKSITQRETFAGLDVSLLEPMRTEPRFIELPAHPTPSGSLILRASRALAKVGDAVEFTVISTKQRGTTYVDVIRDNQTVLTRAVDLEGGRSEFELPLTPDLQGTLEVHAYQILPDENIIRDTRLLYVEPADDLVVEVRPNQETYRPGDPAQINFAVRDQQGRPTLAALGVTIVDESVFALQEMQPGLERIYFALEKELMKPRYEIHGFTTEGVIRGKLPFEKPEPAEDEAMRQRAAAVLFAAAQPRDPYTLTVDTYDEKLRKAMQTWVKQMARDAEEIDRALRGYYARHRRYLESDADIQTLLAEGILTRSDLRDRWGNRYRVHWNRARCWLESAGPDGKWDTQDDLRGIEHWMREEPFRRQPMLGMARVAGRGGAGVARGDFAFQEGMAMDEMKALAAPSAKPAEPGQPQVRLRQFFPETMYVNPAVITDERGRATVTVEMADSITTWRLQALASSQRGQLGSTTTGLRVFQDFFIDIDLPVALTQNDEISIPIAVYNYLPEAQTVRLSLELAPWFELVGDEAEKSLDIAASDIRPVYYRIRAKEIGNHSLTVHARGSRLSDAIKRSIEVLPDGEERRDTWNDRLDGTVERQVTIPKQAIPDASTILVKIYPGLLSQAVEGLDSLLRMPFGCFEQTSSVTYPNILVLDYLKSTKQAKPEIQMKAEQYINVGYQRLLSFEVKGGGFSWFGDPPAHKVLTAYGLMEFRDMSRVYEVDENVITRTQNWLAGLQKEDGSWERDQGGIAEGIINRQTDTLRVTAYIAWALAESGYKGEALARSFGYLDEHWQEAKDPYALAVVANAYLSGRSAALDHPSLAETTVDVLAALVKLATVEDSVAYWRAVGPTFTSAQNGSADLETTALATYALVKSGRHVALANKAITYLIRSKDSFGTWQTTQATVWALKTLLLSLQRAAEEIDATVTVEVNGEQAGSFRITQADYEVVRQVDARHLVRPGSNDVRVKLDGKGSALYQIVAKYYMPWSMVKPPAQELLSIDVDYDLTQLATNDVLTASVRVVNNDPRDCNMVVIDLGVPPGFDVMTEDLQKLVGNQTVKKYTIAARQIIIYLDRLASRKPLEFSYRLRAKFPIKAATPASRVYRYYNPEIEATAVPVTLEVR
jgi:uncharacterized protein YfaS (alpha-2-macroglobulin family)